MLQIKEQILNRQDETHKDQVIRQQVEEIEALRSLILANNRIKNAAEQAKEQVRNTNLFPTQNI